MRFFSLLTAFASVSSVVLVNGQSDGTSSADLSTPSGVSAFTTNVVQGALSGLLTSENCYGAPIPPWEPKSQPGWYYGQNPQNVIGYIIPWLLDELICFILELLPFGFHCPNPHAPPPPPTSPWVQTFYNLTGATQASDYMTYGLVDTIADCEAMCLSVSGCAFVNSYDDVNGKNGSPLLTCSLFSTCHNSSDADNRGGQTQPSGLVDFITNSNGFCYEPSN
ncbi:hypothetical protein BDP27DRAFT_1206756 [Rhodocollybia butyracea]|uniref:Fruit-body specific protein a n=1 Tax=Rhodocollybia butyracea TaxID=206335 RepID=A0A9P5QD10_9AGAR|nr:hypothetical protein BDP27DRAFT_1206756 [Rhodocollybia butyracea]